MSDYQKRFDEKLPQLEGAIRDMPGSLNDLVPGLTVDRLGKLFRRISVLLGRLDSKGARHPQYLWLNGVLSPELIIGQIDQIIANSASGASSLVQNHLPSILAIYDSLEKAIGTDASEMRALLSSVNSDLSVAVSQTDELSTQAQKNVDDLHKSQVEAQTAQKSITQLLEATRNDAAKADAARRLIEGLTNPDGRNKNSLEALARKARERFAEIEDVFKIANTDLDGIKTDLNKVEQQKSISEALISELRTKKSKLSRF